MDDAHEERLRQHEEMLQGLARIAVKQDFINDDLRAMLSHHDTMLQQQQEFNQDVKTILARIETLLARMIRQGDNGREA